MHRPVLVTPPDGLPVSIEEARRQCRIDADSLDPVALEEVDTLLEGYIGAAVGHLEGWTGTLGRVLLTQEWRQDFDSFASCLKLPLGPVSAITGITWRDTSGAEDTVDPTHYVLRTDAGGCSEAVFLKAFSAPSSLGEIAAVSVSYLAGEDEIPKPLKQAILLMVGAWYENREETVIGVSVAGLPQAVAVERLIFPFRRNLM